MDVSAFARPGNARRVRERVGLMPQAIVIGAILLVICMVAGLILGVALHRRLHAAQVADIDGDINALRLRLRELRADKPIA
jgi:hypothetical protein